MSMQNIQTADLVRDEYGNYYEVVGVQEDEGTLKGIQVSNLWFEKSFQKFSGTENTDEKPVGVVLQDLVNGHIEKMQENSRPIYAIRDLMVNRIEVYAVDITKPHPKSGQTS